MSYVITIRRQVGAPLNRAEVHQLMAGDDDFRAIGRNAWEWHPEGARNPLALNWEEDGALTTDGGRAWTTEQGLSKLRLVATRLGASLIGEEGEDLSARSEEAARPSSWVAVGGLVLAVVAVPFVLLFSVLRLPWLVWKVVRSAK